MSMGRWRSFTSISVNRPLSLVIGVHKLVVSDRCWFEGKPMKPQSVCVNLRTRQKKKKNVFTVTGQKVLIYFYMCRDIVFLFLSFAPFS